MNTHVKKLTVLGVGILLGGAGAAAYAGGKIDTTFAAGNFGSNSASIYNKYWPLNEGTTYTYVSVGKDGCEVNPVKVEGTADITIDGHVILTRTVHDQVYEDEDCLGIDSIKPDNLSEDTIDWYAQDKEGNIWYFGEDTKSFCTDGSGNVCSTAGSWLAGEQGAAPGIVMLADPAPGDFYRQEYADEAHDMAKVLRLNADVTLTFPNNIKPETYTGCLITKEWSPLETGAIEHKYYCPDASGGLVLINELQSGTVRTELVDVQQTP